MIPGIVCISHEIAEVPANVREDDLDNHEALNGPTCFDSMRTGDKLRYSLATGYDVGDSSRLDRVRV